MRVGTGQLVCLILGILFVSLGGGMLGGRLLSGKSGAVAVKPQPDAVEGSESIPAKDSSLLLPGTESRRKSEGVSTNGEAESVESVKLGEVAPGDLSTENRVPPVLSANQPAATREKATATVEKPSVGSKVTYVIQAMSTSSQADAHAARKRIMARGFPSGIFEANLPGRGKWYRVYVGPYDAETEARKALETVRDIPGFAESFLKELE
jgi:cell division protein FtsN